jgi:hypothetical protein
MAGLQPSQGRGEAGSDGETLGATDGAEGHLCRRSRKAVTDSAEGHQYTGGLCLQRRGTGDMCHVSIGGAQKYL